MTGTVATLSRRGPVHPALARWLRDLARQYPTLSLPDPYTGNQIPAQRNQAVREMRGPWLLYVDADTVPPVGALERLVAADGDVVGAAVLQRAPGPAPIEETWPVCAWRTPAERYTVRTLPGRGVHPVAAVGAGCLLIRRRVFEALAAPWFRCGQRDPAILDEDVDFCLRAGAAGFGVVLDAGVRCGHATEAVLWPGRDGRVWAVWLGAAERSPLTPAPAAVTA